MFILLICGVLVAVLWINIQWKIWKKPRISKAKNSEEISPKSDPPKRIYEGKILNPKPDFIFG